MPSLNIDLDFLDHPKTVRLGCLVGHANAVELVLRLWTYTGKVHRRDGTLGGYDVEILEAALRWWGKPGAAVAGLLGCGAHIGKVGFLEKTTDGFQVHEWMEHQGHLEAYHQKARAAARGRWKLPGKAPGDAPGMPQACPEHAPSIAPAGQDRSVPREGAPARPRSRKPRWTGALVGSHGSPPTTEAELPVLAPTPPDAVWPRILELIRPMVDARDFDTWFRGTYQAGSPNGCLTVAVRTELARDYLGGERERVVREAARQAGITVPVVFAVGAPGEAAAPVKARGREGR